MLIRAGWRPPPLTDEQFDRIVEDIETTRGLEETRLSALERDVVTAYADGFTPSEIAKQRCVKPSTVHEALKRACSKTGVTTRSELRRQAPR